MQVVCSIEQTVKEICMFRMGRFPIQIPLCLFWTWSSPMVVYKINKSASPSQIVYKNNIPRRFSDTRENFGGSNLKQGYCNLPVTESRICYQLKEISSSSNTENRILGDDRRLCRDDSVPALGEGRVDFQMLSGYFVNAGAVNKRPSKAFGNIINIINNSSCTTVHEVPAEITNPEPLFEKRLQQQSSSRSTLQGGTKLVDIKLKTVKWEVSNFSTSRTFDTVRCIKDRLGDFLSEDINRGSMVSSRTGTAYKYTRTEGSNICDTFIFQR